MFQGVGFKGLHGGRRRVWDERWSVRGGRWYVCVYGFRLSGLVFKGFRVKGLTLILTLIQTLKLILILILIFTWREEAGVG